MKVLLGTKVLEKHLQMCIRFVCILELTYLQIFIIEEEEEKGAVLMRERNN